MKLTRLSSLGLIASLLLAGIRCSENKSQRALFFADRQNNYAMAAEAFKTLESSLRKKNVTLDSTSDLRYLHEDSLKRFGAVVLFNLAEGRLDAAQQNDLERFFQAGGGLASVHTSPGSKYQWPWFVALAGEQSKTSGDSVATAEISLATKSAHESTEGLPNAWKQADALLNVIAAPDNSDVAVVNGDAPISWTVENDGRLFFTRAGGVSDAYRNETFIKHIAGGIAYVLKGKTLDYSKATTQRLPEENRFLQLVLDTYLDEPIEMEIMKDGKVLFIERHGRVKLYDPAKKATKVIGELKVQLEGNYEDGLLGLELDPDFDNNNFIYLYYSPLGGKPVQKLSRFKLMKDSLIMNSEKVVLEVPVQRETCCHSAGAVYFGPDGNLYLSTGDNTSSKESDGYTPIDERPGRAPFDAQKSSGNTHDLRGKILRITVKEDGSYTIPDGNLFPKDGSKGRPEIYVMGARNPYRITVDKRGFLYWGDVGPDGGADSELGPRSHDEWNQARKPGFFGWPYFVADNKAYADFDFKDSIVGPLFNPAEPVNNSPNNYGSKQLPPAQPAMIWYPYNLSSEFPMLGTGSRSAMAGPFYYAADYGDSKVKLPAYYNDKLFIFEWARNFIKVVSFTEEGDMTRIESFLPGFEFWHPIDVKFGKDGAMYVLQYGSNYFARNPDAQLVRIEYAEGNRQPVAHITADKTVGASPLTIKLSATKSFDYDKDSNLIYSWDSGTGTKSSDAVTTFTYNKPGVYKPTLTVTDQDGSSATSTIEVKVGNEPPVVTIDIKGNSSFYFDNTLLSYKVNVTDAEEGTLEKGLDKSRVRFTIDYIPEGKDLALLSSLGSASVSAKHVKGKSLIDGSDCKSCHSLDKKSIGPTYLDVAKRYKGKSGAITGLVQKVIKGGNGNWGHAMMAAHPQLSEEDTRRMVEYILSLGEDRVSLPLEGAYSLKEHKGNGESGSYVVLASYTDKGHEVTGPLTGREMIILRHPKIQAEDFDAFFHVGQQRPVNGTMAWVSDIKDGSYISFKDIDLKGISKVIVSAQANNGRIEIHKGSTDGALLGTIDLTGTTPEWRELSTPVKYPGGRNELFFVFKNDENKGQSFMTLDWIEFKQ
jgi:cytochrome c